MSAKHTGSTVLLTGGQSRLHHGHASKHEALPAGRQAGRKAQAGQQAGRQAAQAGSRCLNHSHLTNSPTDPPGTAHCC